ncbi:hypothetical protein D9615_009842 [Tricholomella constricta]|uniref:Uncharacterized protein n=1 Tax=Tricholomella constricta TaxID=117010 RepID=A0A8H5LX14_9AGAR|nr:hypothetical protein D9615_009842 [Tricholomella constricta]
MELGNSSHHSITSQEGQPVNYGLYMALYSLASSDAKPSTCQYHAGFKLIREGAASEEKQPHVYLYKLVNNLKVKECMWKFECQQIRRRTDELTALVFLGSPKITVMDLEKQLMAVDIMQRPGCQCKEWIRSAMRELQTLGTIAKFPDAADVWETAVKFADNNPVPAGGVPSTCNMAGERIKSAYEHH